MLFWQLMAASPKSFEPGLEWCSGKVAGPVIRAQPGFQVVPKLLIYNNLRFAIGFEKNGNHGVGNLPNEFVGC
jgi:hypothetical protein